MSVLAEIPYENLSPNKRLKMETNRLEPGTERKLMVKKLSEHATVPTRGSSQAAGYDLYR